MLFELKPGLVPEGYGESILSLAAAKAHCRVLTTDDDDLIEALRDAAVDAVEQMTMKYLAPRTGLIWVGAGFGADMVLGKGPDADITAIEYDDTAGVVQTLDAGAWRIGVHGRILPAVGTSWPSDCGGEVRITFDAGFAAGAVPGALVAAVRMLTVHFYDNREAVITGSIAVDVPFGVQQLVNLHRMPVI